VRCHPAEAFIRWGHPVNFRWESLLDETYQRRCKNGEVKRGPDLWKQDGAPGPGPRPTGDCTDAHRQAQEIGAGPMVACAAGGPRGLRCFLGGARVHPERTQGEGLKISARDELRCTQVHCRL